MQGIERTCSVGLGGLRGELAGSYVELDDVEATPVLAEGRFHSCMLAPIQEAAEVEDDFNPRVTCGEPPVLGLEDLLTGRALGLVDVSL